MNCYTFTVYLTGFGETPEAGWDDAIEGFTLEPGLVDTTEYETEAED